MIIAILGYVFIIIFALTALLTLMSLPGWIAIPDNYKRPLFRMLLLEVIGAVIILFTNTYLKKVKPTTYTVNPSDWVGVNLDDGTFLQPEITITNPDTAFILGADIEKASAQLKSKSLSGKLTEEGFSVKNFKQQSLGYIPKAALEGYKVFNSIRANKGEISASDDYALVKFFKDKRGSWEKEGEFLKQSPYTIAISSEGAKTIYKIYNEEEKTVEFSSSTSSKPLFDVNNRIIHFYKYKNEFYLFRITEADLTSRNGNHVHVLQIKFKPILDNP